MIDDLTKAVIHIMKDSKMSMHGRQIAEILEKAGISHEGLDIVLEELLDSGRLKGERIQTAYGVRYLLERYSEAYDRLQADHRASATFNFQTAGIVIGSMNQNSTVGAMEFPLTDLERLLAGTSSLGTARELDVELKKADPRPNVVLSAIDRLSEAAEIVNGGETFFRWLHSDQVKAMLAHLQSINF